MRSLATPGWGPPAVVVCGCLPLLGLVLVTVPRHSWLGSAGCGGGRLCGLGWGFLVLCVFVARCVLVCVSCVRGGVGVGVASVCVGVCVCVHVCGWGRLGLAAGVGVGVVGVCRGWSLATPGGGS